MWIASKGPRETSLFLADRTQHTKAKLASLVHQLINPHYLSFSGA